MQALNRENFTLKFKIEGQGVPAIIIGSCKYYPRTFAKSLYSHLQMIFMDTRGFASENASHTEDDFTLTKLLEDIEALRQHLNLEKVVIIGHSIHALLALEYAKKYPQRISHLVLISASPINGDPLFAAANRYFAESVCPERKILLTKNMEWLNKKIADNPQKAFIIRMLAFAPMIWYNAAYDASLLWESVELNSVGAGVIWGSMFTDYDITRNLSNISSPIFLGLGRYDYWNPPYLWEQYRDNFARLTIRVFEQSGHTPQLEEPENFNRELLQFIKDESSLKD